MKRASSSWLLAALQCRPRTLAALGQKTTKAMRLGYLAAIRMRQ